MNPRRVAESIVSFGFVISSPCVSECFTASGLILQSRNMKST